MHFVYIVKCSDETYYTGYTNNIEKRLKAHNEGKGAKYTRARLPVRLIYQETYENKSEALKREYAIKQLTRSKKEVLIKSLT
ncbi:MAG: GIY-YIG nuclease family protein [Niameybacter sp.]|uniref:GIY-YIG nuclease family protein n=1 Tax=Niameybacter sp. TaxID=2033640 RepID=UPI002FCA6F64